MSFIPSISSSLTKVTLNLVTDACVSSEAKMQQYNQVIRFIRTLNPRAITYTRLHSNDELSEGKTDIESDSTGGGKTGARKTRNWKSLFFFLTGLICFTATISIPFAVRKKDAPVENTWVDCGNNPTQARLRNCHFEPMMTAWIPDACYFPEPGDEYDPIEYYQWFSDRELQHLINGTDELEKLRAGNYTELYTPGTFHHQEHCLYAWRKLAIAAARKLPMVDSRTGELHHSTHCARDLTALFRQLHEDPEQSPFKASDATVVPMIYLGCVPIS